MTQAFVILIVLALLESLYSLIGGAKFLRMAYRALEAPPTPYHPPLSLIVPFRGLDPGLVENLHAYYRQDYPDYQLIWVTDSQDDSALSLVQRTAAGYPEVTTKIAFAPPALGRSQKVENLLRGLEETRSEDSVLVFGDTDIRPRADWLRHLVGRLVDRSIGASTGFRWYLTPTGSLASILRSVWNAGTVSLLRDRDALFAWGGAMAMRRREFESIRVRDAWQGALSDDYALSRAVRESGLSISFQPRSLSFSHEDCGWIQLLGFVRRQLIITRVCRPKLWTLALVANLLNVTAFWGGLSWVLVRWIKSGGLDAWSIVIAFAVIVIYGLGCGKSALRLRAIRILFPDPALALDRWAHLLGGPMAALLTMLGLIGSMIGNQIEWRGIRYRMDSPTKTEVLVRRDWA